jgi:hydroxymethylglutaryl-CoA lyase
MAFGNPYGENYHPDIVAELTEKLHNLEVGIVVLSDTIGVSDPLNIAPLFSTLINEYPTIELGAHFHTTPDKWEKKVDAAYKNGCRRFDTAIKGYGGCPMAKEKLTGNMPTEKLITYFTEDLGLNKQELDKVLILTNSIFKGS